MPQDSKSTPLEVKQVGFERAVAHLRTAVGEGNELSTRIAVNTAGQALYSLWAAYSVPGHRQVEWTEEDSERQVVVGLVYARGEADHRGQQLAIAAGYGDLPYGVGPYGGGWLWQELPASDRRYTESNALYDERVKWNYLAVPFERALEWFASNGPTEV